MTNAALKAMFDEFGDRIACIIFDEAYRIFVGYKDGDVASVNDIIFKNFGGTDFIGVHHMSTYSQDRKNGVGYITWHATENIFKVFVMDEGSENYRIDPVMIG